jgi:periplasmic protein CpxP/Spy
MTDAGGTPPAGKKENTMKMKIAGLVIAAAGFIFAGGLACAQAAGGAGMEPGFGQRRPPMERAFGFDGARGQWWNNPRTVTSLKLTDEQRKAMDAIMQEHRVKLIDVRANLEKAELTMAPLINADQPNETAILAAIDKVAQARADLEKANARFLLALRAKLTPEQWKLLQTQRPEPGRMGPGAGRMGNRPGNPQGGPGSNSPAAAPDGAPGPMPAPDADAPGSGEDQ